MPKIKHRSSGARFIDIKARSSSVSANDKLTVVSLFSGCGGLDIGLEMAGFETLACVETDAHCRETLRYNRPQWKLMEKDKAVADNGEIISRVPGDIRAVDAKEVLEATGLKPGECTLVVGGAPCQPFSNIGKKLGKEDERNGDLFLEFVRFVKGINPKAFIFENVTGITQGRHNDVIEYMLKHLSGLGYGISYAILNAAHYGVPQKRERFFMIGIKGTDAPAFPLPTHFRPDFRFWLQFLSDNNLPETLPMPETWQSVAKTFAALPDNIRDRQDYVVMNISPKVVERMKLVKPGQNFKVLPESMLPPCWRNGKHQGQDTFGRMLPDEPSVTIRTAAYNPSKGMYIHPFENRGLNSMELAALQSFPVDWVFKNKSKPKLTLVSGGRQIGNAVPPLMAAALGKAIIAQLDKKVGAAKKGKK
ncbi:MAG: DNA cytosine methyltransferase [Bacteroidota bacterium]